MWASRPGEALLLGIGCGGSGAVLIVLVANCYFAPKNRQLTDLAPDSSLPLWLLKIDLRESP